MTNFKKFQLVLAFILVSISTFYGGYYVGQSGYLFHIRKNPPKIEVTNQYPGNLDVDFALFWEVWELINTTYLERPVDPQVMMHGAIKGMVNSLDDPYTSFLPPELNESVNNSLNGVYQGIGAELAIRDGKLIIVSPLDGSPAEAAGVRAGDEIVEIEGESAIGLSLTEAVSQIRGEAGTISRLTLRRADGVPFVVEITRGVINIESVTWEDKGNGNIYIRVSRFGGDTNKDWAKVVSQIQKEATQLDAVIVDLRGNPGGYLQSAVYLAEEFFNNEAVLYEEASTGEQTPYMAGRKGAFEDVPQVIVLIDGGSASASEILSGALREHADAILVGQKSFGKGTIQEAKDFEDGSGVHITIAKWLLPNKEWVHKVGITPDIEVENTIEEVNNGVDKQLDAAIEIADSI